MPVSVALLFYIPTMISTTVWGQKLIQRERNRKNELQGQAQLSLMVQESSWFPG